MLTGEDFFALPADENTQADGQGGGNPITMIYRNNRLEPTQDGNVRFTGDITFENALFVPNNNDARWAEFDYNFDASELTTIREDSNGDKNIDSKDIEGIYELELFAIDHKRSGVNEIQNYSEKQLEGIEEAALAKYGINNLEDYLDALGTSADGAMARIIKDKDVSKIAYRSQLLTADPVFAEWSPEINNFNGADIVSVMDRTVLSDEFRIGDRNGFFYREDLGSANSDDKANIVVIKDFNPFMDTLVLHEPEEASLYGTRFCILKTLRTVI